MARAVAAQAMGPNNCQFSMLAVSELPGDTRGGVSVSNNHNWPEYYPGNAWACQGLELPVV